MIAAILIIAALYVALLIWHWSKPYGGDRQR